MAFLITQALRDDVWQLIFSYVPFSKHKAAAQVVSKQFLNVLCTIEAHDTDSHDTGASSVWEVPGPLTSAGQDDSVCFPWQSLAAAFRKCIQSYRAKQGTCLSIISEADQLETLICRPYQLKMCPKLNSLRSLVLTPRSGGEESYTIGIHSLFPNLKQIILTDCLTDGTITNLQSLRHLTHIASRVGWFKTKGFDNLSMHLESEQCGLTVRVRTHYWEEFMPAPTSKVLPYIQHLLVGAQGYGYQPGVFNLGILSPCHTLELLTISLNGALDTIIDGFDILPSSCTTVRVVAHGASPGHIVQLPLGAHWRMAFVPSCPHEAHEALFLIRDKSQVHTAEYRRVA